MQGKIISVTFNTSLMTDTKSPERSFRHVLQLPRCPHGTVCAEVFFYAYRGGSIDNRQPSSFRYEQWSDEQFYRLTLKWDESVWDYTNINTENGIFPTLKQTN